MAQSIIPWHVFHGALETLTPEFLNLWLNRWRFMDGGVLLFDANVAGFDVPKRIFNFNNETIIESRGAGHGLVVATERITK